MADQSPQVVRNDPADYYRVVIIVAALVTVAALGINWVLGPDPALLSAGEDKALRAELIPLRQVPVGEFVLLNDASEHRWVLGPGFAPPESDGTWVRSRAAQLIFYLPDEGEGAESAFSLELSVSPFLAGGQDARPLVVRSAAQEAHIELESGGARVFVQLAPGEEQVVELICGDLDSPAEEAASIDMRRLCVKVYAMAVRKDLR